MEDKEETINDRIEMLVNQYTDGNKALFEKKIGLKPSVLSSYIGRQRRSKPNIDIVTKIITKLDVDPYWLLTGNEHPHKSILQTHGDMSPTTTNGNVTYSLGNKSQTEKIDLLEQQLTEKDERISDLKEHICELKERIAEYKLALAEQKAKDNTQTKH